MLKNDKKVPVSFRINEQSFFKLGYLTKELGVRKTQFIEELIDMCYSLSKEDYSIKASPLKLFCKNCRDLKFKNQEKEQQNDNK